MLPTVLRNGILALSGVLLAGVLLPDAAVARVGFMPVGFAATDGRGPRMAPLLRDSASVWAMGITAIPWMILTTLHTGTANTPNMAPGPIVEIRAMAAR